MKKLFATALISATALGTVAIATPAFASEVAISLDLSTINQSLKGNANQATLAAAVAVGTVGNDGTVSATGVDGVQMADVTKTITQTAGLGDLSADITATMQTMNGNARQAVASVAGVGSIGNGATVNAVGAALVQSATVSVTRTQK